MLNSGFPLFLDFVIFEAFVFRAGFRFCLGSIAEVLRDGSGADVSLSIVEAVAVYMVAEHVFRDVDDLTMHPYLLS